MEVLLLLLIYPITLETSHFVCDQEEQCQYETFVCENHEDCIIICSASDACYNSDFFCPSSPNTICNIKCNSTNATPACQEANINGNHSSLIITITGLQNQFGGGSIDCGTSKQCNVQCGNNPSTDIYMCSSSIVNATKASNLSITGYGVNSLQYSTIYCPNNGNCNITVIGEGNGLIPNSKIYIHDHITTNLSLICKSSDALNCYGGPGYEPILLCYDGQYNCTYITNDGIYWHCEESDSRCALNNTNYTIPTSSPTISTTEIIISSSDNANVQYLIISFFMMTVITIICSFTVYKFNRFKNENEQIKKWIFYIAVTKMGSFALSYTTWFILVCMDINHIEHTDRIYLLFQGIMYLSFIIGWMSLYTFMLNRLYYTFKDSVYKMSGKHIYFHIIILIFIPVWYLIITIVNNDITNDNAYIYLILSLIGSIFIFSGLLTLIVSFNRKLFKVIVETDAYYLDTDKLLKVVTKQTLLGSIMIMSMLLFVVVILILTCSTSIHDKKNTEWIVYEWMLAVLILTICVTIFIGFKMNVNEYEKICKVCHTKLISSYKLLSRWNNQNDNDNLIDSQRSVSRNISYSYTL